MREFIDVDIHHERSFYFFFTFASVAGYTLNAFLKKVTRCFRDPILDFVDMIYQKKHVVKYLEDEGG